MYNSSSRIPAVSTLTMYILVNQHTFVLSSLTPACHSTYNTPSSESSHSNPTVLTSAYYSFPHITRSSQPSSFSSSSNSTSSSFRSSPSINPLIQIKTHRKTFNSHVHAHTHRPTSSDPSSSTLHNSYWSQRQNTMPCWPRCRSYSRCRRVTRWLVGRWRSLRGFAISSVRIYSSPSLTISHSLPISLPFSILFFRTHLQSFFLSPISFPSRQRRCGEGLGREILPCRRNQSTRTSSAGLHLPRMRGRIYMPGQRFPRLSLWRSACIVAEVL